MSHLALSLVLAIVGADASVVRVYSTVRRGYDTGCGTVIRPGNPTMVLSCSHIIMPGGTITVRMNGATYRAKVIANDGLTDLSLIEVYGKSSYYRSLASSIRLGEGIRIHGLGKGQHQYRSQAGRIVGFPTKSSQGRTTGGVRVSGSSRKGDSGSPILNENGDIVGVVAETRDGTTCGASLGEIRALICPRCQPMRQPQPVAPVWSRGNSGSNFVPAKIQKRPPPPPPPATAEVKLKFLPLKEYTGILLKMTEMNGELRLMRKEVVRLKAIKGQNGKDGLSGKDGSPGKDGKDGSSGKVGENGKDAVIDDKVMARILKQIKPFVVEIVDRNGKVVQSQVVYPGGKLKLSLEPLEGGD